MGWNIIEQIMSYIERTLPIRVFDSIFETLSTVKLPMFTFITTMISVTAIALAMFTVLEDWYWEPLWTIPILVGAYVVDLYTAIRLSGAMKGQAFVFQTNRFKKWVADLIGVLLILGMLHGIPVIAREMGKWQGMGEENLRLIHSFLVGMSWTIFTSIFITSFLSAIGNASKAGMIHPKLGKWISKRIDTYKPSIFDDTDRLEMLEKKAEEKSYEDP